MDQTLPCVDQGKNEGCEGTFTFTERDQEFYTEKGYTTPKRCPVCRKIKKAKFADQDRRQSRRDVRDTVGGGFNEGLD